jgi:hypothetical protein
VSLPFMLLYALAPRPDASFLALAALGLASTGMWAMIRLRTWGLVAMAGAAGLALAAIPGNDVAMVSSSVGINLPALATVAGLMMIAALAPFATPVARWFAR